MKKLVILLAFAGLVAGCSSYNRGTPGTGSQSEVNGAYRYPASNPIGAPGATVEESLEGDGDDTNDTWNSE